jgi:aminoglycoside phosphotransferase (APT) family kinase protein
MSLDSARVAEIVGHMFPQLAPAEVRLLGEGCDNVAFEVNAEWVFRFPKRADVEEQLLMERRLLPALALRVTLAIPTFAFVGEPSTLFPFHFAGYPMLPGRPAIHLDVRTTPFDQWAPILGRFLSSLHAFPVSEAVALGVKEQSVASLVEEVRDDALADVERVREVAPDAPIDAWREYLKNAHTVAPTRPMSSVVVHRDLAAEHVLCDPTTATITGIIDWSDIAISEPVVDFAGLLHWGGDGFLRAVLATYGAPITDEDWRTARFLAACRGASDIAFGLDLGRPDYIDAGLRALTANLKPSNLQTGLSP